MSMDIGLLKNAKKKKKKKKKKFFFPCWLPFKLSSVHHKTVSPNLMPAESPYKKTVNSHEGYI